jgi:hypothetical protein
MKIDPAILAEFDPANFTLSASCLEPQTTDPSAHATDNGSKTKAKFDKFFYMFPEHVFEGVWNLCEQHNNYAPLRILSVLHKLWFEDFGRNPVRLTSYKLRKLGISRWRKYRALKLLEEGGYIFVERVNGDNPFVTLKWFPNKKRPAPSR